MSPLHKPLYIDPVEAALPTNPPFVFRAVTSRVFPLKANMARLSAFCDQYVNMTIPPTIAHFRPSLPYVYLMVLNYGSMSPASVEAQNLGWVAQHEMAFTVPLEWWREENGRLVFQNFACVSPFIWVDDQMSLTTGREVYGWPKVAAHVDADVPLWTQNPVSGERVFSLSTCVFPKLYAGEQEVPRVLLQIDRAPPPTYSAFPPDPNNPWLPLTSLADAVRAGLQLSGDALDMLFASRIRGYHAQRSPESLRAMIAKAGGAVARLLPSLLLPRASGNPSGARDENDAPELAIDAITLKQFRAAEDPSQACYQALVASSLGFDRLNQGGLLGDVNLLRGDPSGGFSVRLHRYGSQPIIESLGLEVAEEYEDSEGVAIATLKPTFPFWNDIDLHYGKGRLICSRTVNCGPGAGWTDEQPGRQSPVPDCDTHEKKKMPYNTAIGAATQPVCGPFTFPDVTLQVYPLLADRAHLDRFVARYMTAQLESEGLSFRTFGAYVYMMVSVFDDQLGSMWSGSNNVGWWAEREVTFAVPVKVYRKNELLSLGLLSPFVYANSGRAVITDREVNGRRAMFAAIDQPPDAWLTRSGPVAARRLLQLSTEMFPAANLGQRTEQRTLVEIDEYPLLPYNADVAWRTVAEGWGGRMVQELKRKTYQAAAQRDEVQTVKALALEPLANGLPFNWVILKQYRDAWELDRACYQSVIITERSITDVYDGREIEADLHVRVHKSVSHPIVETLGLVVKSVDSVGGSVVQNLQPWRPFWMRIGIEEKLGKVVAWRATDAGWHAGDVGWLPPPPDRAPVPGAEPDFLSQGPIHVGAALGTPGALCQDVKEGVRRWLRRALVHEVTWVRASFAALSAQEQAGLRQRLSPAQRDQLGQLMAADSLPAFVDALGSDMIIELTRGLVNAGLQPSSPPLHDSPAKDLLDDNDAVSSMTAVYGEVMALSPTARAALELSLSPSQRGQLERLRAAASIAAYCQATDESAVADLLMGLLQGLGEWAYDAGELQRLTHDQARRALDRLDEIQVVIESILSDDWGNWGDPRCRKGATPKPAQCVPVGSVYGMAEALQTQRQDFEREYGLSRFEDAWWYVAPDKPQGGS